MIDVNDFVSRQKLNEIIDKSKKLETLKLAVVKEKLGAGYSYTEIKFALAYLQNAKLSADLSY